MECSLGIVCTMKTMRTGASLNPYSNGMLTWTNRSSSSRLFISGSLNPYSNGMLTWSVINLTAEEKAELS